VKPRALKPLLFPAILMLAGFALGAGAETAVARQQNYVVYGHGRTVAHLPIPLRRPGAVRWGGLAE